MLIASALFCWLTVVTTLAAICQIPARGDAISFAE
jgi:hypothetical protein